MPFEPWQMAWLLGIGFALTHHVLSHQPVRSRLIGATGTNPFLGVYSAISIAFYAPLAWLWWTTSRTTPIWWAFRGPIATGLATVVIAAGFALAVGAVVRPGRTSMFTKRGPNRKVQGMSAFSRHPLFFGIALVSVGHLIVDGGAVDVAFHGTNLLVGLIGAAHQDQRYAATDPDYLDWMARTRLVPLPWPVAGSEVGVPAMIGALVGLLLAFLARVGLH